MNHDDKLKEAAEKYAHKKAGNNYLDKQRYAFGFLAGAAYRDPEIKALLEIVKIQREALKFYTRDDPWYYIGYKPWKHGIEGYESLRDQAHKAIISTDEKLKSMGVEI